MISQPAISIVTRGLISYNVIETVIASENVRANILEQLKERLQHITTANGYRSNANVEIGLKTPDQTAADQFPKIWIIADSEAIDHFAISQKESKFIILLYGYVKGIIKETLDTDLQALVEDILQAIFKDEQLNSKVDYVDNFEINTTISEPYGIVTTELTYIFERNQ